jgi:hypothetical protein
MLTVSAADPDQIVFNQLFFLNLQFHSAGMQLDWDILSQGGFKTTR